jgi:hypothetical protein
MRQPISLSLPGKLTVAALLVAALGFAMQIVFGLSVPTIPPGLLILVVAAALVALVPQRWAPGIGVVVGVFMLVGFFASGALLNLVDPARLGVLVGAWVQFIAVIVTTVTGLVTIAQNYRRRTSI